MSAAKQKVLLYGNCQGEWLARNLLSEREFNERFELIYVASNYDSLEKQKMGEPGFFETCAYAIWQTAAGFKPPEFVNSIPATCRQLRFPAYFGKLLWPFHISDTRNTPEPGFPNGRYPYGDRIAIQMLEKGVPPEEIAKQYLDTDIKKLINLDRYEQMYFAEMRFNDKESDFAITPFIEKTFRDHQTFEAVNHPSTLVIEQLRQGLLAALLGHNVSTYPADKAKTSKQFGTQEVPIHPQVAAHYKLKWVQPTHRWRYGAHTFLFEEYILAYAKFTPIMFGHVPEHYLARAEGAIAENKFAEAQEALLEGASLFPKAPELLLRLAKIYLDASQDIEAEKVLRYAITKMPRETTLYCALGETMVRRGFTDEAVRMYKTALQFDPRNQAANQALQRFKRPA